MHNSLVEAKKSATNIRTKYFMKLFFIIAINLINLILLTKISIFDCDFEKEYSNYTTFTAGKLTINFVPEGILSSTLIFPSIDCTIVFTKHKPNP